VSTTTSAPHRRPAGTARGRARARARARVAAVVAGLAVPALVLAGCGGGSATTATPGGGGSAKGTVAPSSHTLHLSFLQDPGQPPDPDVYYAGTGLLLTRDLYEGLVQYQPGTAERKIVPSLASSFTESANGLAYTFELRRGVTFHDGTPFTSAAVEPSFARRLAVNGGPAYQLADVASVHTPGPYTVVITLKQPNTAFLDYLASPYGPVMESPTALKAHAGTNHDQTYLETHDIGTGPYTLTEAKVGVAYQMVAYPRYWGAKPYYTTVDMPVIDDLSTEEIEFNDGQLDGILNGLTTTATEQYAHSSSATLYTLPTLQAEEVYVNEWKGFLASNAARSALLEAIDVKNITAAVFPGGSGTVADQTAPANLISSSYAKQTIPYDPSVLKGIVAKLPSAERSITIGYDTGAPDDELIAEQIGAELLSEGITAKVVGYQTSSIFGWVGSVKSAKTQAPNVLVDYFWPDADNPYTWTHISYDPSGGLQYLACQIPQLTALDAKAVETGSDALYNEVSDEAEASGCYLALADKDDAMVFKPWMRGVAAAHVVASPETLLVAKLYPS
jgi:peptide/nickel transport system substrate-binding protein